MLREDDGLTLALLDDACYRTNFTLRRHRNRIVITASVAGHGYPEFRRSRFRMIFHGAVATRVTINNKPMPLIDNTLIIENRGEGFLLEASLLHQLPPEET